MGCQAPSFKRETRSARFATVVQSVSKVDLKLSVVLLAKALAFFSSVKSLNDVAPLIAIWLIMISTVSSPAWMVMVALLVISILASKYCGVCMGHTKAHKKRPFTSFSAECCNGIRADNTNFLKNNLLNLNPNSH